jgi:tetratricopeptide (TPR) repeat protein
MLLADIYIVLFKESTTDISKELAWKMCGHDQEYDDARFRRINSELFKHFQKFLINQELENTRILQAQLLLESANKRRIKKLINTSIEESKQALKKTVNKSSELYLFKYQIEKNLFYLNEGNLTTATKEIEIISEYLDKFFIAEKLKYYCEILGREYLSNVRYSLDFIDEIMEFIRSQDLSGDLVIQIYLLISRILSDPDSDAGYFKLKELLFNNYMHFEGIEQQELFGALINYCSRKINLGSNQFHEEVIEIFEFIFQKEIILNETYITPIKFNTIITSSLRMGNFNFAVKFVDEYQEFIPESQRKDIVSFSLAQIYFYKKDFERAIDYLQTVEYLDDTINRRARILLLATYFEMGQVNAFLNYSESLRVFLGRLSRKVSKDIIKSYTNFINVSRKIINLNPGDKENISKIEKEIDKYTKNIINESWLREKLEERKVRR